MARPDPRKLKDDAAAHVSRGKWQKALENYVLLEKLEPRDGTWPQRIADMWRRLNKPAEAITALIRAADVYSNSGFLLKAIAVCKLILEIDPSRTEVEEKLAGLHSARLVARPPRIATIVAAAVPPASAVHAIVPPPSAVHAAVTPPPEAEVLPEPPRPPAPRAVDSSEFPPYQPTLPGTGAQAPRPSAGAALDEVKLRQVVPGSRPSEELEAVGDSAAYEIPLGEDDIEIVEEAPSAADTARAVFPRTPLFSALDEERLRTLIARVSLRRLSANEVLFRRGDPADELYVVSSGEVVALAPAVAGGEIEVARMREGAFFGEIALLTSQPRSATIQAVTDTELIVIPRLVVMDLIDESPEALQVLLRFMRDRLIEGLVETNPLFAPFSGGERRALAGRFKFLEADAGVALLTQGQRATGLFILLTGSAEIVLDGKPVGTLPTGGVAGETSLLRGSAALATVVARTKLLLLLLPRADFQEVIMTHPQVLEYISALADDRPRQVEAMKQGTHAGPRVRVV